MKKSMLMLVCLGAAAWLLGNRKKEEKTAEVTLPAAPEAACEEPPAAVPQEPAEAISTEPKINESPLTVYYTENGKVFHTDHRCVYLRRSASVLQTSVEVAALAGKTRPCSGCAAYMEA